MPTTDSRPDPDELTVERVLRAAELVPSGSVVTYGDLAELVGTSARRVGTIMSRYGAGVPWWRVVNAAGGLPPGLLARAREHWAAEGIAPTRSGRGCRLAAHRADPGALGEAYARATGDLPDRQPRPPGAATARREPPEAARPRLAPQRPRPS